MNADWPMTSSVVPHYANKSRRRKPVPWSKDDRAKLTELWYRKPPLSVERIAEILERDYQALYAKARSMGLPRRRDPSGTLAAPMRVKGKRSRRLPADGGKQRRFAGVENHAGPRVDLQPHHPAARLGTTFFPKSVVPAAQQKRLLKAGHNSRKIGDKLTKGKWAGQQIYTLTLVERETCPRSCKEWLTCYGNNMPFAERNYDDGTLTKRLWAELAVLAIEHRGGFVVRLHVLGDFGSVEYVEFWRQALQDFPELNIFGFTARVPPDPIGIAIAKLAADFYDRFRIRFSGGGHETDCSEVVDRPEDVNFVRCPAETDPERCCATCGLCMQSNVSISFVRH